MAKPSTEIRPMGGSDGVKRATLLVVELAPSCILVNDLTTH
jgi:hypothetical protein